MSPILLISFNIHASLLINCLCPSASLLLNFLLTLNYFSLVPFSSSPLPVQQCFQAFLFSLSPHCPCHHLPLHMCYVLGVGHERESRPLPPGCGGSLSCSRLACRWAWSWSCPQEHRTSHQDASTLPPARGPALPAPALCHTHPFIVVLEGGDPHVVLVED